MEALNETDEPLNPYSRLFMLLWAIAMIIVAGFRPGAQDELVNTHTRIKTRHETQAILSVIKIQSAQSTLVLPGKTNKKRDGNT